MLSFASGGEIAAWAVVAAGNTVKLSPLGDRRGLERPIVHEDSRVPLKTARGSMLDDICVVVVAAAAVYGVIVFEPLRQAN